MECDLERPINDESPSIWWWGTPNFSCHNRILAFIVKMYEGVINVDLLRREVGRLINDNFNLLGRMLFCSVFVETEVMCITLIATD
jgi:hypothetical protein